MPGDRTVFLRLVETDDKARELKRVVQSCNKAIDHIRFNINPRDFEQIPGAPFAYWAGESVLVTFKKLPPFESQGREAQHGLSTKNDFRYIRLWWERRKNIATKLPASGWLPTAKGGKFARYYTDVHLLVNWLGNGREIEADVLRKYPYLGSNAEWVLHRECNYLQPGLTWSHRTTSPLSVRALPSGCTFGTKGPAAFSPDNRETELLAFLAITNSQAFRELVEVQLAAADAAARSYDIGVIRKTPVPELDGAKEKELAQLARRAWSINRNLDSAEITSHAFLLPAMLQVSGESIRDRADAWREHVRNMTRDLQRLQRKVDGCCFELYDFAPEDRKQVAVDGVGDVDGSGAYEKSEDDNALGVASADLAAELVDWLVGVAFGVFDVRLADGTRQHPSEPEPFDSLPVCSPGMLTDYQGLPVESAPGDYPVELPPEGVLVEDGGVDEELPAEWDVVQRVRAVIEAVFGDEHAPDIESGLCWELGVKELRSYMRRSSAFFKDHLGRYSKSRRKAPLFWPLSVNERRYTVWVYYPQLSADTLYTVIGQHVAPKISQLEERRAELDAERHNAEGREASRLSRRVNEVNEAIQELGELRERLEAVAGLPYRPCQDDGVQITAAPLYSLFRLTSWRRDLEKTWKGLRDGQYEWAHLAYAIWPERVQNACRTDRSIAIAHDREDLYEGET